VRAGKFARPGANRNLGGTVSDWPERPFAEAYWGDGVEVPRRGVAPWAAPISSLAPGPPRAALFLCL